jgi:hypothetical protein
MTYLLTWTWETSGQPPTLLPNLWETRSMPACCCLILLLNCNVTVVSPFLLLAPSEPIQVADSRASLAPMSPSLIHNHGPSPRPRKPALQPTKTTPTRKRAKSTTVHTLPATIRSQETKKDKKKYKHIACPVSVHDRSYFHIDRISLLS